MNNPLYDELLNLRYIPISAIDEELPPESVVLYFKNLSQLDKRISVEPIHGVQLDLQSQNPTIELEDYKATFCLGPSPYIPIVTINPISDFTDPSYPLTVTVTGTITRTDNYIPNEIVVNYNNQNKRATLVNDTEWSVTFDLRVVSQNLTEYVTAKANSIDVNSSVISGYSEIVTREFNIIFLEVECTPSVDKVSCLCLDVTKNYKVTVDGQSITGTFDEVVAFLDSHGLYAYPGGLECDPCAESTNKFTTTVIRQLPPEPSIASGTNEFRICLAPVILPKFCDNAINYVGFDYYRRINGITFELKNRLTDEVLASGSAREYWDLIDAVNTSSVVFAKGIEGNDGTPGIVLQNISNEDLQLILTFFTGNSEQNADVYQEYQADYYNDVDENPTYNQIDSNSFEVCLSASICSTETKTLTFTKKPTADLREYTFVIKYLIESSGFTETLTDTLVYSGDYSDPTSTTYNVDYAETVCDNIRSRFEQYSNITFENSQPENVISPINNCIDNRGDVQFELRLNGLNTSINTIDLIMTEDRGATLIKVSTPANSDKNAALNSLASQLVAHGYTSVAPANNARITLKKSDVRSLCVITSGYTSHSFSVNGADWGYDGNFNVEGVYRENVAVRPMSCTLGLKDPYRNFENYTLTFKGYPLKGPSPVNYTKITILPVDPESLLESQLDFLTTLTDLDSFSFETCETNIRGPE